MKLTKDNFSREQIIWLVLHGALLLAFGMLIAGIAWAGFDDAQGREPRLRWFISLLGGATMVAVGTMIFVASAVRLRQPFAQGHMQFKMLSLVFGESLVIGLGGGMILDCGETAFRLILCALLLNVCLLGFKKL